ncbi:UEV domain-containing protein [Trametes polyzona]|nr:UEV domain-containing protein [Trametes polyzona]
MSTSESLTQKWLREKVQTYPNPDLVYAHADAVLARHPTIRPKTAVYTYDDGRTQVLLCLHGLLPISFRGASYNIPIAVWVPREYPRTPPMAYVVPTSDMLVRPAPDMDISGRCFIDYLRNWERKCEGCSLVALLDAMQDAFSRQPPVYAKPKDFTAQQPPTSRPSSSAPDYAARPPPPLPVERQGSVSSTAQRTTSPAPLPGGPPPLPAKPGSAAPSAHSPSRTPSVPVPQANANSRVESPASLSTPGLATRPPPPLPPHPPQELAGGGHYAHSPAPPTYSPLNRGSSLDLPPHAPGWAAGSPSSPASNLSQSRSQPPYRAGPQTSSPPPPPPPLPPAIASGIPGAASTAYRAVSPPNAYTPAPVTSPYAGQQPPPHPPYGASPPYVTPQPSAGIPVGHAYVSPPQGAQQPPPPFPPTFPPPSGGPPPPPPPAPPSVPPPDLLDAEDEETSAAQTALSSATGSSAPAPAPPRPPNPELLRLHEQVHAKVASELASLSQAMAIDAERLRANQADLLAGEPAIRDEMARLEAVRDVCRGVAARLAQVVAAGERNVAELRRKGDPEVDELVCSTTIVHNQLVNLVAEDNAIEDTIYHLHRALNAGRIDLERFLRTTRVLAEEQFMKRALIEKIQAGITPGDASAWSVSPGLR